MSKEFDFGGYGKEIAEAIEEVKEEKEKPTPAPRRDYKKENDGLRKTNEKLIATIVNLQERNAQDQKTIIPTLIKVEILLNKLRLKSPTTKFLYKRIVGGSKPDRATVQKLLDFFRYAHELGEL